MDAALSKISAAKRALQQASTLEQVLEIRDQSEAIRTYLKASKESLAVQNAAADIKLRAERKVGELLRDMDKNPGSKNLGGNTMLPPKLEDLGITKMQSSRWQLESTLPEDQYECILNSCNLLGKEFTQSVILSAARKITKDNEDLPAEDGGKAEIFELISEVRTTIAKWIESFGLERIDTLINVLKSEVKAMEVHGDN